ncbi:altered inheritance of mitochondria protein 32-like [Primulina tabacum]|uniref:altered inheritance of mitochondria protein 32-like n=1 Tax=Primulina tabacum TaxID=48773 RepID=UPI003F593621
MRLCVAQPTRFIPSISQLYVLLHSPRPIPLSRPILARNHRIFFQLSALMAGQSESFSTTVASADEETTKYGFERAEMYQKNLAGTVNPYERHLFLCYKSHESWPSHVENSESDPLPTLLASALKARKKDIQVQTRLTICEGGDDVKLSDGDVMIFPDMIVYRDLKDSDVDSFVDDVLVSGNPWVSGIPEELTGSYVFVCAHNNRDRRCGLCGPVLIEKFKEEIEYRNLKNQVFVTACSHVGGHKYAGNVITFSADPEGKIVGNWYGYVTPNDVVELLDQQIVKGQVIDRIWRGQMVTKVKETEKVELKLANGTAVPNNVIQPQENAIEENVQRSASCCQGANGFSCCRDENTEQKQDKNKMGGLSCWTSKLEQRHVLTTVAIAGAVVTVALAYAFYKRAR